ncbi:MAGUK p55 subfamily member 3 isoform X2 [Carassius auratus]|uniref:MAGUK p55 subfamily member 3 isoform X2 n=1 Tax=Carassius auratus TaxID=7957 RepID=A0A6P6L1Z5_CARAU|nr:MAGUK p55 subfamily member 3-like isoform X2 [Carassius auratus]XP_052468193.1 MAGUK p55 subfamily member 3 isoform X1 [Carassius gibelio]XP_052468194.1 MAGUK p55 subfamily member 3 isoform X1 [Carassius gibelio]
MPVLSPTTGLHEMLALLTSQLHPDANHKEDMVFLREVFSERSLSYLMKIHERLRQFQLQSPTPVLHSASCLAEDVTEELQNGPLEEDERELLTLLTAPHVKAVLTVHDIVAQKNFEPVLPPLPDDLDDELEEESVKIVRLVKNKEPLGATIRRDEVTGAVVVARIMRGGAADRSGLVHVGDELREVNGNLIIHKRPEEISQILSQSQGSITLKIIPAIKEEDRFKESKVYLRALFDYTPFEDKATPCQEAGLPFTRGDILQVVSQDDPTWWQAKRVGDSNLRAGLIPSRQFQERRLLYRMKMGTNQSPKSPRASPWDQTCEKEDCDSEGSVSGQHIVSPKCKAVAPSCGQAFSWEFYSAGLRRSFRLSRKDHQGSTKESRPAESTESEFFIYEEVTLYQMRPQDKPRLVVLIGSLGARINELKQKVIAENPHRYGVAVPHTTRPRKSHEKEGVEYHFISKQAFEADIQSNKFIEHGEYKNNQYGTSLESIRSVLVRSKVCLVDVQPEALKILRTAEFKPYVIFIRPRIPEICRQRSSPTSPGRGDNGHITDEDLQDMRQSAEQMDQQYGHLVDRVLVKEDSASACVELRNILERLEREPQWVPVSWVRS